MKNLLTIAGSDCSGGAGIQADLKTFSAFKAYGMSVITSVVAENTSGVISAAEVPPAVITAQIKAVFEDIEVHAVKLGMLSKTKTIEAAAESLSLYRPKFIVADPVMEAKDGSPLMEHEAILTYKERIIPLTYILTPNIPEAEILSGIKIRSADDMKTAARKIFRLGAKNVLIKGGHLSASATDVLFDGTEFYIFDAKRVGAAPPHGTGCALSSAITAGLSEGLTAVEAVKSAKEFLWEAIKNPLYIGKGNPVLNHFYKLY